MPNCSICDSNPGTHYFGEVIPPSDPTAETQILYTVTVGEHQIPVVDFVEPQEHDSFEYWECDSCFA